MDTSSDFQGNIPGAPPPPPEVKVRTMRSDLESMARSGGGAPRFENVAVVGASAQNTPASPRPADSSLAQSDGTSSSARSFVGPILVVVVALVALAVVGYFAYTVFYASAPPAPLQ